MEIQAASNRRSQIGRTDAPIERTTMLETMIHLELTNEEAQDLREEVQKRFDELEHEIAHTEALNFKEKLKRRRETIRKLLEKLPEAEAIAT
jgi:phage regulator Rha-like protein